MTRPPAPYREAFAQRLNAALQRAGKSRRGLAQDLGLHQNTVGNWIRAATECPVGWLPEIAAALGVTVQELVGDDEGAAVPQAAASAADAGFARRVVEVLERPLAAPDLMTLLSEAETLLARSQDETLG